MDAYLEYFAMEGWIFDKEKKNDFASVPPVLSPGSRIFSIFFYFLVLIILQQYLQSGWKKNLYHFTKFSFSIQI